MIRIIIATRSSGYYSWILRPVSPKANWLEVASTRVYRKACTAENAAFRFVDRHNFKVKEVIRL